MDGWRKGGRECMHRWVDGWIEEQMNGRKEGGMDRDMEIQRGLAHP